MKSLKAVCFESLGPFLTASIRKTVVNANAAEWFGMLNGQLDLKPEMVIKKQVHLLKHYLWSHIIWYDYDVVFKIVLASIDNAIQTTRKLWKPGSNIDAFRNDMENVVAFTEVAANYELRENS